MRSIRSPLDGLRSPFGRTQRGAADPFAAALSIIQDNGGALFLLEDGDVFQDRSVTPSTAAAVGDPVGTIIGRDGTWFAIAVTDAARCVLQATADGRRYLQGVASANRYLVQDASANPLTPATGALFTAVWSSWQGTGALNPFCWGSDNIRNSFRGKVFGDPFGVSVTNSALGGIAFGDYIPMVQNTVYTLRHQDNPTLRLDGVGTALGDYPYNDIGTGTVNTANVGQFAIGTRENDAQSSGAIRHYCYALIPAILSDSECATIEAALYPYVRQAEAPISADVIDLDFANGQFSWGGAARVLGDLTDNLDGSYTLDYGDWGAPGYLISIDFLVPDWSLNADTRIMRVERDATTSEAREGFEYDGPSSNIKYRFGDIEPLSAAASTGFGIGTGTGDSQGGLQRATLWVRPDEVARFQLNGYIWQEAPRRTLWKENPDGLTVWETFTAGNILRVRAKGGTFTQAQADEFHSASDVGLPAHVLGDSFVVFGEGSALALQRVIENDGYVNITFDGVGGATMANHLTRMQGYPSTRQDNVYTSTLVINDGGWSYSGEPASSTLTSIDSMVALLEGHDRWIYVEPWPSDSIPAGATRDLYEEQQALIAADIGNRYIPTVHAAQCAHGDDAQSLADVANDLIPDNLSADGVHPKTPDGYTVLARCIRGALARLGYWDITTTVPGAPTSFSESSLALSWGMPSDDGNDPVRSWTVYVEDSPGAGTFTSVYTGQLRRHTLTGLTTGTWKVRVTATNEVGEGAHAEIEVPLS